MRYTVFYRYRELCPETCGLCGEGDALAPTTPAAAEPVAPLEPKETGKCEDKAKNCNELIDFCTQENTNAMMRAQCAMTCAFCSTGIFVMYNRILVHKNVSRTNTGASSR